MATLIKNTLKAELDTWDDPGDYPSGAGGGPLASYQFVCGCSGEVIVEVSRDEWWLLQYITDNEDDEQLAKALCRLLGDIEVPEDVKGAQWQHELLRVYSDEPCSYRVRFTIEDCKAEAVR